MTDFLGMPILDGDEILGELFLANKHAPGGFTDDDEELLRLLAAHAAIALVNARLYERSRELSIMEERHRIARELHDAMTQKLFSLRLTADAAATLVGRDPAPAAETWTTVAGWPREAADELRAIMVDLRPADLAGDGLVATLRKQAELLDRAHGAAVAFAAARCRGCARPARRRVYRVAQEALHNALRHGAPGAGPDRTVHTGRFGRAGGRPTTARASTRPTAPGRRPAPARAGLDAGAGPGGRRPAHGRVPARARARRYGWRCPSMA